MSKIDEILLPAIEQNYGIWKTESDKSSAMGGNAASLLSFDKQQVLIDKELKETKQALLEAIETEMPKEITINKPRHPIQYIGVARLDPRDFERNETVKEIRQKLRALMGVEK